MIGYLTPSALLGRPAFGITLRPALTVARIKSEVAGFYGIQSRDLDSEQRGREIARPRQIAMYLARELTLKSYPNIGRQFGKRDHTTVMHGCKRIKDLIRDSDCIAAQVRFLRERLAA